MKCNRKKMLLFLNLFLVVNLAFISCNSERKNKDLSPIELRSEQEKISNDSIDSNIMTVDEFDQIKDSPDIEDRKRIIDFFNQSYPDEVIFDPLLKGEKLKYKVTNYRFFKGFDRISCNEIVIYRELVDDSLEEITRLYKYNSILNDLSSTDNHIFINLNNEPIEDNSGIPGYSIWHIDGEKGIGSLWLEKAYFSAVSNDLNYFATEIFEGLYDPKILEKGEYKISIFKVFSRKDDKYLCSIDFLDYYKPDPNYSARISLRINYDPGTDSFIVTLINESIKLISYQVSIPDFQVRELME